MLLSLRFCSESCYMEKTGPQEPLLISTIEPTDRYRKDGFCKPHLQNALGSQEFYGCLGGAFILSPPRHF